MKKYNWIMSCNVFWLEVQLSNFSKTNNNLTEIRFLLLFTLLPNRNRLIYEHTQL